MNLKSKFSQNLLLIKSINCKSRFQLPFAFTFVLGLKFLGLFREVHVHTIKNHRIGHFATNTELSRLSSDKKLQTSPRKQINIYCCQSDKHSNFFLGKMWNREILVLRAPFGQLVYDICKRVLDRKSTRLNSSHVSESRMPSSA